jgi:hypothetical protein
MTTIQIALKLIRDRLYPDHFLVLKVQSPERGEVLSSARALLDAGERVRIYLISGVRSKVEFIVIPNGRSVRDPGWG